MLYQLKPLLHIPDGARIVVPLSFGQLYHQGQKLKAYADFTKLEEFKNCTLTFLIPEVLEACKSNEKSFDEKIAESRANWASFLNEYKTQSALKDATVSYFLELIGAHVDGKKIFKEALEEVNNKFESIEELKNDIYFDAKKSLAKCTQAQSIEYLKTELAVSLTLSRLNLFDVLIYPKAISRTLMHLYTTFGIKTPKYIQVENNIISKNKPSADEFFQKKIRASQNLPTPLKTYHKMLLDLFEANDVNPLQLYALAELVENTAKMYKGKYENEFKHQSLPIAITTPSESTATPTLRSGSL